MLQQRGWVKYCSIHPKEELMMGYICSECCKEWNKIIKKAKEMGLAAQ